MSNKRILIFIPSFTHGGAQKQGFILAKALKTLGYDVHIWAFYPNKNLSKIDINELVNEGISCFIFPFKSTINWSFSTKSNLLGKSISYVKNWYWPIKRIKNHMPKLKFDVIIPFTFQPCIVSVLFKNELQAQKVFWNYRGGYDRSADQYSPFLIKKILSANVKFIANSSAGAKYLIDIFNLRRNEVKVINNAFIPENINRSIKRVCLNSNNRVELLQLANFFPEKDWDTLVEGMAILKKMNFNVHLHLVGAFINKIDFQNFKDKVLNLGVEEVITYHGSLEKKEILSRFKNKVHIGVLSSKSEGTPNCIMEYMYWKLPVVATDIDGTRDLLGDENEDYLFNVGDASGFANKISLITSNEKRFKDVGEKNHIRILNHFSVKRIIPQWVDLIDMR